MNKLENYRWTKNRIKKKVKDHFDLIATLANVAAILKSRHPNFFWVGFYFYKNNELILGPFQGPPACMRLELTGGVCAAAVLQKKTIVVDDVDQFPGHVACDCRSKSEIVIPIWDNNQNIKAVLDVDSEKLNDFEEIDKMELEEIVEILKNIF